MHIAEGVLSAPVLIGGAAVSAAGVAIGLRKMDFERVPRVAVLASAFFVASLIHVPLPPSSAHLILNGLAGLILGWAAFPALLVALFLQSVFFGFGGLTALGVNTATMALPAVACYHLFSRRIRRIGDRGFSRNGARVFGLGAAAGALSIVLTGLIAAAALATRGEAFSLIAKGILLAHIPIMAIEGLVTGQAVVFLRKVRPELLEAPVLPPVPEEGVGA